MNEAIKDKVSKDLNEVGYFLNELIEDLRRRRVNSTHWETASVEIIDELEKQNQKLGELATVLQDKDPLLKAQAITESLRWYASASEWNQAVVQDLLYEAARSMTWLLDELARNRHE